MANKRAADVFVPPVGTSLVRRLDVNIGGPWDGHDLGSVIFTGYPWLVFFSATSFNSLGGQVNFVNLREHALVMTLVGLPHYFNQAGVHLAHAPALTVVTTPSVIAAGAHSLDVTVTGTGSASDNNDNGRLTVYEVVPGTVA